MKKKTPPRNGFEDSDEDSLDDKKLLSRKKLCQYHGKCSQSTDECTTLKALINRSNQISPKDT